MNYPTEKGEFVGGPWDGPTTFHPMMNSVLSVEGHPEGRYWYMIGPPDFKPKYYWIFDIRKTESPPVNNKKNKPEPTEEDLSLITRIELWLNIRPVLKRCLAKLDKLL